MLILAGSSLAATLQVVTPAGRVLTERPLTDAAEAVFTWRGRARHLVVESNDGRWDAELETWRAGRQVGGLTLSATQRPGECLSLSGEPTRDALTVVINDGAPDCFEAPVPYAKEIARLDGRTASEISPNLYVDDSDRHFAMLYDGSRLSWRVIDADGEAWTVQLGVREITAEGLQTVVAWRRAEPILFWRPTVTSTATLPYGTAIALAGPADLMLRAELP